MNQAASAIFQGMNSIPIVLKYNLVVSRLKVGGRKTYGELTEGIWHVLGIPTNLYKHSTISTKHLSYGGLQICLSLIRRQAVRTLVGDT
jgi:hypothetical protein